MNEKIKKLLIIEDDELFAAALVRSLSKEGYNCQIASNKQEALELCKKNQPSHILLDLQLGEDSGQDLIFPIKKTLPSSILVMLTGYGTIPSAVQAIKDGAHSYLSKPSKTEDILKALEGPQKDENQNLKEIERDHIQKVLLECGGNITKAAENLGLHRRTLQRKLKQSD